MKSYGKWLAAGATATTLSFFSASFGAAAPAVTVAPNDGHPKLITHVSGSGFGANEAVDVYFDTADKLLVATDAAGAFAARNLDIPKDALPGIHWVTGVGRKTGNAAQAVFVVDTSWLNRGFDARRRGRNPYENVIDTSNVSTLDMLWSFPTGGYIDGSPAYDDGIVYIGSSDKKLYALNASTGAVRWSIATSGVIESSPALANGKVYVGTDAGKLHAYNTANGAVVWTATAGARIFSSPVVANGLVYVGSDDGYVYAFNSSTGAQAWKFATQGAVTASPAVVNRVVYVGGGNLMYALNGNTGAFIWSYDTGGTVGDAAAVANGVVYFGSYSKSIYAVRASNGALIASNATAGAIASPPTVAQGVVYCGSDDNGLYAFNASDLGFRWMVSTGGAIWDQPTFANGVLYVRSNDGILYALDKLGTVLWTAGAGTGVSSPIVADGMVFTGSEDDNVYAYALDAGTAAVYHRSTTPPSYASLHPDRRLKLSK